MTIHEGAEVSKQALFRRYRSNLPNSLTSHNSTRLRLLTLGTPVSVLGTISKFVTGVIFIGTGNRLGPPTVGWLFLLLSGSHHNGTPQTYTVK